MGAEATWLTVTSAHSATSGKPRAVALVGAWSVTDEVALQVPDRHGPPADHAPALGPVPDRLRPVLRPGMGTDAGSARLPELHREVGVTTEFTSVRGLEHRWIGSKAKVPSPVRAMWFLSSVIVNWRRLYSPAIRHATHDAGTVGDVRAVLTTLIGLGRTAEVLLEEIDEEVMSEQT
jgi:hypothetical protein